MMLTYLARAIGTVLMVAFCYAAMAFASWLFFMLYLVLGTGPR